MKFIYLLPAVLLASCTIAPKSVYVHPERYQCDLIIPTIWDGSHPVEHFEHELVLGAQYHDYYGMKYRLVESNTPGVFILQIDVERP